MPARSIAAKSQNTTRDHVLDVAERLAQTRGFNGFSYADIAAELGITKASLHYHYRTKTELGCAIIGRYGERFRAGARGNQRDRPTRVAAARAIRPALRGRAAERPVVPVRDARGRILDARGADARAIRGFFEVNEAWLAQLLESGRATGDLTFEGAATEAANAFTCTLEGAMLLARSYGDATRFETAAGRLLREYAPASGDGRTPGRGASRSRNSGGRRG